MFEIKITAFEGIEVITLFNSISEEYVSVIPSHGGNLHELVLQKENILYDVLYKNNNTQELLGTNQNFYRGAKLSPFPNRIDQGEYIFENTAYALTKNDNAMHALHGLLWNKPFNVHEIKTSLESAEVILSYSYQQEHEGYPFSYIITITYQLSLDGLTISTRVVNTSNTSIPIGDGWHPYITTGIEINQLKLKIPTRYKIESDEKLIPTGKIIEDNTFEVFASIGDATLDTCFVLDTQQKIAETILLDEEQNIRIVVWQESDTAYPYVHIYTPPDRRSLAIEPISCIPNAFASKNSIHILKPEEERTYAFGIMLR